MQTRPAFTIWIGAVIGAGEKKVKMEWSPADHIPINGAAKGQCWDKIRAAIYWDKYQNIGMVGANSLTAQRVSASVYGLEGDTVGQSPWISMYSFCTSAMIHSP